MRTSSFFINEENRESALVLENLPTPTLAGSNENYTWENLENGDHYFAIKAFDEMENSSEISNNAYIYYFEDEISPATISDLSVISGNAINNSTIQIQWTASGDDENIGTAHHYEIRYHTSIITDINWNFSSIFANPPDPAPANSLQTCNITGLNAGTKYYFAIKVFNDASNESGISNTPAGKIA